MHTPNESTPLTLLLEELSPSVSEVDDVPTIDVNLDTETSMLQEIATKLATNQFDFEEAIVKENLAEILLLLIGFRGATHGKELMGDISKLFNAHLSPGTVYPALHELEAAEVLEMHKLVRTKEYTIADDATARAQIERSMAQHLAIGLFLYGSLQHV